MNRPSGGFMKKTTIAAAILAGLFVATTVSAHHAFEAEYDLKKPVTVTGKVTKITLVNPHGWIYLDSKNAQGKIVNWAFELPAAANLVNQRRVDRNVFSAMIESGEEVTVTAYAAKDGSQRAWAENLTRSDKRTVITLGGTPGQAPLQVLDRLSGTTANLGAWWKNTALVEQLG